MSCLSARTQQAINSMLAMPGVSLPWRFPWADMDVYQDGES
jgi:hypothetical protein